MKASTGFYSLIQYCPDLARREVANIGVLLFCPEMNFIEARMAERNSHVKHFFHSTPDSTVNFLKMNISEKFKVEGSQFKTLGDLQKFINSRANEIFFTEPLPVKVDNPITVLADLYARLIDEEPRRPREFKRNGRPAHRRK